MPKGLKGAYKFGVHAAKLGSNKGKAAVKAVNSNSLIKKRDAGKLGKVSSFKEHGRSRGGLRAA